MKTLFVADDNELDLRILKLILARNTLFCNELYFNEGRSLINYIRSNIDDVVNLPDIIFVDTNMPAMGGWKILEFLKTNFYKLAKPVSVYIISTCVDADERQRALSFPFVKEFIPKPICSTKIVAIAKEAITQ